MEKVTVGVSHYLIEREGTKVDLISVKRNRKTGKIVSQHPIFDAERCYTSTIEAEDYAQRLYRRILFLSQLRLLARAYLDNQHVRVGSGQRIDKLIADVMQPMGLDPKSKDDMKKFRELMDSGTMEETHAIAIFADMQARQHATERELLKRAKVMFESTGVWEWCLKVRGLAEVAGLTFLGYIDPYEASTVGKAWAYLGLAPGLKMVSGKKGNWNPEAKGRFIGVLVRNVILQKDPYYYPWYVKRKEYLAERCDLNLGTPFKLALEDPKLCPNYKACMERMRGRAERVGDEAKKVPACKAHLDGNARIWLGKLLVEHSWRLMRESEGLPVPPLYAIKWLGHEQYIPPKPLGGDKATGI